MGATEFVLFANVAASGFCLVAYLLRRRSDRQAKAERMARALRTIIQQEVGVPQDPAKPVASLVLQQANS